MKPLISSVTRRASETEAVARKLASMIKPDDVIAMYGSLGAGKTCFVKGLAKGLNAAQSVRSPTFTLINEYHGDLALYHLDLYRLNSPSEIEDIGWTEYLDCGGVLVIEWAEKVEKLLPEDRYDVHFQIVDLNTRKVEITGHGSAGHR